MLKEFSNRLTRFLLCCFTFLPFAGYSQQNLPTSGQEITYSDCINVKEISIPFNKDQVSLHESVSESTDYNLVYYLAQDEFTFWYKLIINSDCALKFSLDATNLKDDYDFLLYRFSEANFCEAVVDNLTKPVNDNQYKNKFFMSGAKQIKTVTAYQKKINAKKGEVYYLSVLNISGEDCGHILQIEACNSAIVINSVHKPCFVFGQPQGIETKKPGEEKLLIVEEFLVVSGLVRDNESGRTIDAQLSFEDAVSGNTFTATASPEKGYGIVLERGRKYNLECNAFGYYPVNGTIDFSKPAVYDYYLLKMRTGDQIVLQDLYFHPNTFAFRDESTSGLEKLLTYLQKNEKVTIEIRGHTAGSTSVKELSAANSNLGDAWNFTGSAKKLSKLRAETVQDYLIGKGIDPKRLSAKGFGAEIKLYSHPKSEEERRQNMRVEILIISTGAEEGYPFVPTDINNITE